MPEGPEIRRAADQLAGVLEGQIIRQVYFGLAELEPHAAQLRGKRVVRLETRGKALLTHFEHGITIYSHNQLYGLWRVARSGQLPATNRVLRLLLDTGTRAALLYSASDISVWRTEDLALHPFLARVGPDILAPDLTPALIAERLASGDFCRRSLAALYLDQSFVAGIGNYLRSEILFDAAIHPWTRPVDLTPAQRRRLARSTLAISRRSYETAGITNPPGRAARLKRQGKRRSDYRFAVFDREGQACFRCGAEIQNTPAGSRRLYWCPLCQSQ